MIDFAWFWFFLVLPLPWLVRRFWAPAPDVGGMALRTPFLDELEGLPAAQGKTNADPKARR